MKKIISMGIILLLWASMASAATIGDAVEVSMINDDGWVLPFYPVKTRQHLKKVYAEA